MIFKHSWHDRSKQRTQKMRGFLDFLREQTEDAAHPEGLITPERFEIILHHPNITTLDVQLKAVIGQKPDTVTVNQFLLEQVSVTFQSSLYLGAPETTTQISRLDSILEDGYRFKQAWNPNPLADIAWSLNASAVVFNTLREHHIFNQKNLSRLLLLNLSYFRDSLDELKNKQLLSKANIEMIIANTPIEEPYKCNEIVDIICLLNQFHSKYSSLSISEANKHTFFSSETPRFSFLQWCLAQPQLTREIPTIFSNCLVPIHDDMHDITLEHLATINESLKLLISLQSWYTDHPVMETAQEREILAKNISIVTLVIAERKNNLREKREMTKYDKPTY